MKLGKDEHRAHDWRVHALMADFELADVWRFPIRATGEPGEDFETFCAMLDRMMSGTTEMRGLSGWLFRLRLWLGRLFGWDKDANRLPIPGCRETTLRARLPAEEQAGQPWFEGRHVDADWVDPVASDDLDDQAFRLVYRTADEQLNELGNATVHAGIHLGWRAIERGVFAPEMAIYVKHRGSRGRLYMALIKPFRHLIIYPTLLRRIKEAWESPSRAA